jgi:hypothetical protein
MIFIWRSLRRSPAGTVVCSKKWVALKDNHEQQAFDTAKTSKSYFCNTTNFCVQPCDGISLSGWSVCMSTKRNKWVSQTCTILKELPVDIRMQRLILSSTSLVAPKIAGHCPNFLFHHFLHLGSGCQISGFSGWEICENIMI